MGVNPGRHIQCGAARPWPQGAFRYRPFRRCDFSPRGRPWSSRSSRTRSSIAWPSRATSGSTTRCWSPRPSCGQRIVYTRTKVQNDVKRILDLYRRSGRFAATVEPKVIQLEQNRVDLVFEIDEGRHRHQVDQLHRQPEFSDGTLRGEIITRETAFWRIFSATDTYDPDRLSFDRELLRRFYLREGYADFRVVSAIAELAPDREGFIMTFTVEEGEEYTFGKIDVITTLRNLGPRVSCARGW